uniref:Uncharacterized protein n=1 Tax=Paramoeba aestuarina TaxID=180227 RepID=A0A7S4PHL7_9EUKA
MWALGCMFLVLVYLSFVSFNAFCLYRLKSRSTEGSFRCKHLFHQSAVLLCLVRALENAILVVSNYKWPHADIFYQTVAVLAMVCAIFFALVYASVLIYWFLFVMQVRYGRYLQDKVSFMLHATQIFFLTLILLYVIAAVICNQIFNVYSQFLSFCFVVLGTLMLLEGVTFCIAGILLYVTLHSPISQASQNQKRKLSSKSIQIMVLASAVTVILVIRASFLFNEIDFHRQDQTRRPNAPDDPNSMYMGNEHWWFYVVYYFCCDCIPLLLMMIFQARLPRKPSQPNRTLMVNKHNEENQILTPSSGSDMTDDELEDDIFERLPPKMTLIHSPGEESSFN